MYTLRRKNEVRAMSAIDELDQVPTEVNEAEVALARQVIGNFEGEIDLGDTPGQYQAELRSVVDAKIAGEDFVVKEEEAPAKVVDLMAALRKSLDSVSTSKKEPARSAATRKSTRAKRRQA
jgi:DNA end-binding protein Ku